MRLSETDIEIIERDNHIPPEKSILTKEERRKMSEARKGKKLFAELLQKELDKVFEKHIEDLKNMKFTGDGSLSNYEESTISEVHRS